MPLKARESQDDAPGSVDDLEHQPHHSQQSHSALHPYFRPNHDPRRGGIPRGPWVRRSGARGGAPGTRTCSSGGTGSGHGAGAGLHGISLEGGAVDTLVRAGVLRAASGESSRAYIRVPGVGVIGEARGCPVGAGAG